MRSLPILLPAAVIRARACPLASIRQIRTWRLRFVEHEPAAHEPARPAGWSDVVEAFAVPRGDRPVTGLRRGSSAPLRAAGAAGAPCWPVELAGDGFAAVWDAPRPVAGRVRLRGDLVVDPLDGHLTTGRIHRVRLLTEIVREDATGEHVVALTARDLSAVPKAVDDGSPDAGTEHAAPGTTALDVRTRDRGVLLDLELGVS